MNSNLIKGVSMFLTGATMGTALTFGTINTFNSDDLSTLEQHVSTYQGVANGVVDELEKQWQVQIDSANAEIGDYQEALEQANGNILTLKEKASELNSAWTQISNTQKQQISQLQQDKSDKDKEIADLKKDMTTMESNYNEELERLAKEQQATDSENQAKINELIRQANAEIKKAEDEIKALKNQVVANIEDDELTNYEVNKPTLEDENDKTVIDTELDFTMPNKPNDDETTGGETGGTTGDENVNAPTQGTVAYLEVELYNVLGNQIIVEYNGMSDVPVSNLNGTNVFRIEVPLSDVTNSSADTLYISYSDKDLNSVESNLVISGSVNQFVGIYNMDVTGLSDTGVQSLKVVIE